MRSDGDSRQVNTRRSGAAVPPQYSALRTNDTSEPPCQASKRNGPVPLMTRSRAGSPPSGSIWEASQPLSAMPNDGLARRARKATSGRHSSNTTVSSSSARMRLRLPS